MTPSPVAQHPAPTLLPRSGAGRRLRVPVAMTLAMTAVVGQACRRAEQSPSLPPSTESTAWFEEVAASAGLAFEHRSGAAGDYLMPEIMGGGVATFDANGDGHLDILAVQSAPLEGSALFLNDGSGHFAARPDGLRFRSDGQQRYGMGVAVGDIDGDGDLDAYLTAVGDNALLLNDGTGRFAEAPASTGAAHPGWGTSAAFFDYDRDGDLDLAFLNYLVWSRRSEIECRTPWGARDYCKPQSYNAPGAAVLLRNDGGSFTDVSRAMGLRDRRGTGLGLAVLDLDQDGWLDLFIANDGMADHVWRNQDGRSFEEVGAESGCSVDGDGMAKAGMGVVTGDLNQDGTTDVIVGNLARESDSAFVIRSGLCVDATARLGLGAASRQYTRFGMALVDFDGDGWLDLYQANGRVALSGNSDPMDPYAEPDLLLVGRRSGFTRSEGALTSSSFTSRGLAVGDFDRDGRPDLVVVDRDAPLRLLRNQTTGPPPRQVHVTYPSQPSGTALGAYGARVVDSKGRAHVYGPSGSYLSSSEPAVRIPAGEDPSAVDAFWWGDVLLAVLDSTTRVAPPSAVEPPP